MTFRREEDTELGLGPKYCSHKGEILCRDPVLQQKPWRRDPYSDEFWASVCQMLDPNPESLA